MMASGEIRLSAMTMRQMPVLAQGQINTGPSADGTPAIVVTSSVAAPIAGSGTIIDGIMAAMPWLAAGAALGSLAGDTVQNQQVQYVIRGGVTTPAQLIAGTTPIPGTFFMSGFSVTTAPNMTPDQLAAIANY